jgi:hypothetical protein
MVWVSGNEPALPGDRSVSIALAEQSTTWEVGQNVMRLTLGDDGDIAGGLESGQHYLEWRAPGRQASQAGAGSWRAGRLAG